MFEFLRRAEVLAQDAAALSYVVNLRAKNMKPLEVQDFKNFARPLNLHPMMLHAFFFVESANSGFMSDGRLIPCPEPHVAYRNISGNRALLAKQYPQLFYPRWINERKLRDRNAWHPYRLSHIDRWDHIIRASAVDFNAGLCGASYGAGQQLGEGYRELGFPSVVALLERLYEGQFAHLEVMIMKLRLGDQLSNLKAGNLKPVIAYYNGPANVPAYLAKYENAIEQKAQLYA
jgi:hypothetical protein